MAWEAEVIKLMFLPSFIPSYPCILLGIAPISGRGVSETSFVVLIGLQHGLLRPFGGILRTLALKHERLPVSRASHIVRRKNCQQHRQQCPDTQETPLKQTLDVFLRSALFVLVNVQ